MIVVTSSPSKAELWVDALLDPRNTNRMLTPDIIRRRIASLLKDTETLPPLESLPAMEPAEQAGAMTTAWHLRQRAFFLSTDLGLETLNAPKNNFLSEVAHYSFELHDRLRHYDRCAVDLLALSRRPLTICAAELQSAVDAMIDAAPNIPLERSTESVTPLE